MCRLRYTILFFFLVWRCSGQHWVDVETPFEFVTDIAPKGNDLCIVGSSNTRIHYGESTDGGETWSAMDITEVTEVMGTPLCVGFFTDLRGMIGVKGSLVQDYLITEDGGETWNTIELQLNTTCSNILQPHDIYVIDSSTALINGFQSGRYMTSKDQGQSWSCSNDFGSSWVPEICIASDSIWYTKDIHGFYMSNDSGNSWVQMINKDFAHFQVNASNEIIALSFYYNEPHGSPVLYRTEDDWISYDSIPLHEFNDKYVSLFLQTYNAGLYVIDGKDIYYAENGINDFELIQSLAQEPFRITYLDDNWYLSGRGLTKLYDPLSAVDNETSGPVFRFFPNPATDRIYVAAPVECGQCELIVYDTWGNPCIKARIGDIQGIDVSDLPGGIYMCVAVNKEVRIVGKIVIVD